MLYDYNLHGLSSSSPMDTLSIVALVLAVVATVLAFIFIVPEKRRSKLGKFGKFLHDTCNFKYLIVEKILQALYIFATAIFIFVGFFMLFCSDWSGWMGGKGILLMILGPIALRLVYELLMMAILSVKNIIAINNKLRNQNDGPAAADVFAAPDMSELKETVRQKKEQVEQAVQAHREENDAPTDGEK